MPRAETEREKAIGAARVARPGMLTEQLVFRVSKATRLRIEKLRRVRGLDNIADALRLVLREAGL